MKRSKYFKILIGLLLFSIHALSQDPYIVVLGTSQDGGYPHLGCEKECCDAAWSNPELSRNVVSLALADPETLKWYLFEATPDIKKQIKL